MKQKIEAKDILKGDKIRVEISGSAGEALPSAIEYTAGRDRDQWTFAGISRAHFLIEERPVVLPTEEGYYESERYPTGKGFDAYQLSRGDWYMGSEKLTEVYMKSLVPLRKMGTERDIANKVLNDVESEFNKSEAYTYLEDVDAVRKRYNQ